MGTRRAVGCDSTQVAGCMGRRGKTARVNNIIYMMKIEDATFGMVAELDNSSVSKISPAKHEKETKLPLHRCARDRFNLEIRNDTNLVLKQCIRQNFKKTDIVMLNCRCSISYPVIPYGQPQ